jgi:hypothetical protein
VTFAKVTGDRSSNRKADSRDAGSSDASESATAELGGYGSLLEAILMCEPEPVTCSDRKFAVIGELDLDAINYWGVEAKAWKRAGSKAHDVRIVMPEKADRMLAKGVKSYGYMIDRWIGKHRLMVVVGPRQKGDGEASCRPRAYMIEFRQGRHHCSALREEDMQKARLELDAG